MNICANLLRDDRGMTAIQLIILATIGMAAVVAAASLLSAADLTSVGHQ